MKKWKLNPETKLCDIETEGSVSCNNPIGVVPLEYLIVVKCEVAEEKTEGGIILPDNVRDKEKVKVTSGVITDLGSKAFEDFPAKPEVGDVINFKAYKATMATDDGEYRYIADKDILSVKIGENND